MKTFIKILLLAVVFTSCDDFEPTVFNSDASTSPTFLSFSRTAYSLPVERDATGTAQVILNSSTVTSVDRVYNVVVIPNDTESGADPATYSVPSTVTIPAGEYSGTLVLSGTDGGLVDGTRKTFTLKLADADVENASMDNNLVTITVFEVCALQDEFVGTYQLTQLTPLFAPAQAPAFEEGVVEVRMGSTPFERVVTVQPYPGFGLPTKELVLDFACDFVNMGAAIDTEIFCVEGENIIYEPTENPSMYDTTDDSYFELTFVENATSRCGTGTMQTIISFTKVE